MRADTEWLRSLIRDLPDHPAPGIMFRDITPLLADPKAFRVAVDALVDLFAGAGIDHVVGIEARGFIFAAPVAYGLSAGFVPVRKPGKLPWQTEFIEYALEYGTDRLEIHLDAVAPGDRVLIVDDVLATGGTAVAAISLLDTIGATVVGLGFLLELDALGGRARLGERQVASLVRYG
jgi:adenine phosphoribosyltransferase